MKIVFRADGGMNIGMGHIARTTVLAQILKSFAEIEYLCRPGKEFQAGKDFLTGRGFKVEDAHHGVESALKNLRGDCLITDSYQVDEKYFDFVKNIYPCTGYIDDLNKCSFNVDFLINQNPYAGDLLYRTNRDAKLFLGTRFALLREEFRNLPTRKLNSDLIDVLVTVGGSDASNLSHKVAAELARSCPDVCVHLVIGPSFIHKRQFEADKNEKLKLYYNPLMSELMLACDAAISGCGSTLYELAACGTPTIGILAADNQKMAAEKMKSLGVILFARDVEQIPDCIRRLSFEKRSEMSRTGQGLVDGMGAARLAEEINMIVSNKVQNALEATLP